MFSILRQSGTSSVEERIAMQYALTADVPISSTSIESLEAWSNALREGMTVPVGSVEFVRRAMALAGVAEPENLTYPDCLRAWLRREVSQRRAGSILGRWFIKPVTTKMFTGFVCDTRGNPDHLSCHDRAQYNAFLSLPADTSVWVSEPVTWLSEVRYYVVDGEIRGSGRYDDGPDDMPEPDLRAVAEMVSFMTHTPGASVAFGLDAGVLDSGETALVECNDAWALGYYRGTLSHRDYFDMLWRRWAQLLCLSTV